MKVSRKVARRKHSRSSSISRRRLRNKKSRSGYKKKHAKTQKGGKRGRGQKRVHVHTRKRGRRFHRGGGDFNCNTLVWTSITNNKPIGAKLGYFEAESNNNVTLFVIKKGSFTFKPDPQVFKVKLIIMQSPSEMLDYFSSDLLTADGQTSGRLFSRPYVLQFAVFLDRDDSDTKPVGFHITRLGTFTNKKLLKKLARINSNNAIYDFSSDLNDELFKAIQSCVKNKLKEVYERLLVLLSSFKLTTTTYNLKVSKDPYTELHVTSTDSSNTSDVKTLLYSVEGYRDRNHEFLSDSNNWVTFNIKRLIEICNSIIELLSTDDLTPEDFQLLEDSLKAFSLIYKNIKSDTTTQYWPRETFQRERDRRPNYSYVETPTLRERTQVMIQQPQQQQQKLAQPQPSVQDESGSGEQDISSSHSVPAAHATISDNAFGSVVNDDEHSAAAPVDDAAGLAGDVRAKVENPPALTSALTSEAPAAQ